MGLSSVLVAARGESYDDELIRLACDLLNSSKGKLYVLHVIEVERAFPIDAEIAPATAKGEEVLNHVEEVAKACKRKPEAELVQARQAGSALVQWAVEKGVEAIVLGSTYGERYGAYSLGDTIPYVLENAPCRVIVWRNSLGGASTDGANR